MKDSIGGAVTGVAASTAWIAVLNDVVQIVAGIVAIIVGLITVWPKAKAWYLKRKNK